MYTKNSAAEIFQENERLKQELQMQKNNNLKLIEEIFGNQKSHKAVENGIVHSKINVRPVIRIPKIEDENKKIFEPAKREISKKPEKTLVEEMYNEKFPQEETVTTKSKRKGVRSYVFALVMIFGVTFNIAYINAVGSSYKSTIDTQIQMITDTKNLVLKQDGEIQKGRNEVSDLRKQVLTLSDTVSDITVAQKSNADTLNGLSKSKTLGYYLITGTDKHDLNYVKNVLSSWKPLMEYKEHKYDCSNMSAHLEWYLESNGIKADMVMGQPKWAKSIHAWVYAYGTFGKIAIETTQKKLIYMSGPFWISVDPSYYDSKNITATYASISDVPENLSTEFDWNHLLQK